MNDASCQKNFGFSLSIIAVYTEIITRDKMAITGSSCGTALLTESPIINQELALASERI